MTITVEVLILFAVVLIGALCRKLGYLTDETIHGISQIVVNITLPCLTIVNMQKPFNTDVLINFLLTFGLAFLSIVLCIVLGLLIFKSRPRSRRAVLANLLSFSNCGFMGYPVILAINPDWMIYAVAYNIAFVLASWTVGVSLFQGRENISLRRVLLNPNVIASVIGFVLFCSRITIPAVPTRFLNLVGGLTTPLSMLLIGPRLCGLHLSDFRDKDYHLAALLRLVLLPLLVYVLLRPLPLAPAVMGVLFLLTAMPSASTVAIQAELYGGDVTFAARAVAYSTFLCMLTIPVVSLLL